MLRANARSGRLALAIAGVHASADEIADKTFGMGHGGEADIAVGGNLHRIYAQPPALGDRTMNRRVDLQLDETVQRPCHDRRHGGGIQDLGIDRQLVGPVECVPRRRPWKVSMSISCSS